MPFRTPEEAFERANNIPHGLSAEHIGALRRCDGLWPSISLPWRGWLSASAQGIHISSGLLVRQALAAASQ